MTQLSIINMLPSGDKRSITTRNVANIIHTTIRQIRQDINTLITVHSIPIGSKREGDPGYFLIETSEQRDHALHPLYAQMSTENKRIRALANADIADFWAKKKAGAFTERTANKPTVNTPTAPTTMPSGNTTLYKGY